MSDRFFKYLNDKKGQLKNFLKNNFESIYCINIRKELPYGMEYSELIPAGSDEAIGTGLLSIENGRYVYREELHRSYVSHSGRVTDSKGRPLIDTCILDMPDRLKWYGDLTTKKLLQTKFRQPRDLEGSTLLLSTLQRSNEFFHFIFDAIINCGLIAETKKGFEQFDTIILPAVDNEWKKYFLAQFDIPEEKISTLYDYDSIKCETLVVPVRVYGANYIPAWVGCYAKKYLSIKEDVNGSSPKKLYISRSDADRRGVVNEEEIVERVKELGFSITTLTDMPIEEQQRLFRNADIVIGPHGAGFSHIFNMEPGKTVVEFSPWEQVKPCFLRLCAQLGLQHYHFKGCPAGEGANMYVEPEALANFLRSLQAT